MAISVALDRVESRTAPLDCSALWMQVHPFVRVAVSVESPAVMADTVVSRASSVMRNGTYAESLSVDVLGEIRPIRVARMTSAMIRNTTIVARIKNVFRNPVRLHHKRAVRVKLVEQFRTLRPHPRMNVVMKV